MDMIADYSSAVAHYASNGHWHAFMGIEIDSVPDEPKLHKYSWEMTPQELAHFGEEK